MPISLTVTSKGPPAQPTLFILSPQQPEGLPLDKLGDEVCLAAGSDPKGSDMVLNVKSGEVTVTPSNAALSQEENIYYTAGFINETIYSCELNGTSVNNENFDLCADLHPEKAKLSFHMLVMNAVRVVFTKTVAFNTLLTIRAVIF